MSWPPEMFWKLFEASGSIWAYLAYRRCMALARLATLVSLN